MVRRAVGILALVGLALATASCGAVSRAMYETPSAETTAARADSLLEADRAFAARAREAGAAAAFQEFMEADGKLLGGSGEPVAGSEAIYAIMATLPEGADLSWSPVEALISESGELGVTWGEYRLRVPGANGAGTEETGRYLTVWRKDAQGRWRGVLDIGT